MGREDEWMDDWMSGWMGRGGDAEAPAKGRQTETLFFFCLSLFLSCIP